jgi:ABC-type glycerol-3-phosphate transport system permease component
LALDIDEEDTMRHLTPGRAVTIAVLSLAALVTLLPMYWMTMTSFKPESEIYTQPPSWFPPHATLENYTALFNQFHFGILTFNSLVITVSVVAISVLFGTMAAYGFSRYRFAGSAVALGALLMTRMVTPASLVVPLYVIMQVLGLLNTLDSIVVGIAVLNVPFVVWIMKPFFDGLPKEMEEASILEGLSPVRVFWRIALPMSAPGLFAVVLFSFVAGWVDLLFGITFSTTPSAMPLTAGLMQMQTGYKIYWGPMMAGGIYLSLPSLLVALLLQRYLTSGLRMGY